MAIVSPKQPWTWENEELVPGASFEMRPLTHEEFATVLDIRGISGSCYRAASLAITGWSGIKQEDGQTPQPFDPKRVREMLELLPWSVVLKIGDDVIARSMLSGEDKGNSPQQ